MSQKIINNIYGGMIILLLLNGCKHTADHSEEEEKSGLPVTVSPVRIGALNAYVELSATSVFLYKASIKSPVTGYIENMFINPGQEVEKNHLLFTVKTKEASAIRDDSLNNLNFSGIIKVNAATAGLISSIEHSNGDYVAEGDPLCQIAVPGSLVFILDVPFELSGSVKQGSRCEISLPDSQMVKGIIKTRFPSMTSNSQTERFIVQLNENIRLPENLVGKIRIIKESVKNAVILPKTCILTDETMQNFWVMKLVNDTLAVKVPVNKGLEGNESVQITAPVFKSSDLFLSSGNYGLGDSAYVNVIKQMSHEGK